MSACRAIVLGSAAAMVVASACSIQRNSSGMSAAGPSLAAQPERASPCSPVPVVRAPHQCPYRTSRDELSGWVYLRFGLTPDGRPSNITVVESDPPGVFDRAAIKAVAQYQYSPCNVRLGRPIEIVLEWRGCNADFGPRLELEPPGQM